MVIILKVKRICKTCGKEFFVWPSVIKYGGGKCCSRQCNWNAKVVDKIKCICQTCGGEFFTIPSKIKIGCGKYCSRKCLDAGRIKQVKRICQACGKEFEVNHYTIKIKAGHYCSIKCRDDSKYGDNNPNWKGGKVKCICKECGKEFWIAKSYFNKGNGRYCSKECLGKAQSVLFSGVNNPSWKGGTSYLPYCPKFNKRRKKAVRDFFNNTCLVCGKTASENVVGQRIIALCVHHADHDKEQGCNGKPFNLVPLCHDCHTDEMWNQEEYHQYINKTLREGFKWGIWNEEEYIRKVMYPDD